MRNLAPQLFKGFEFSPIGHLMDQFIEIEGDVGLAYERSLGFYKDYHVHDRLMVVFPRGSSRMKISTKDPSNVYTIDSSSLLIVPLTSVHNDIGTSSIYDTVALYPASEYIGKIGNSLGLAMNKLKCFMNECRKIKRSKRLDGFLQEYFFERVISRRNRIDVMQVFERAIFCEIFSLAFEGIGKLNQSYEGITDAESLTTRAISYIETNLFTEITIENISKHVGTSSSTLLRHFKRDTLQTPYAYIKNRRLDEAILLLKKGTYQIGTVALMVGYEDFSAFSYAFRKRFGKSPSSYTNEV